MDYFVPYFLGIAHSCINLDVMEEEKSFAYSRVASCILGGLESFFYILSLCWKLLSGENLRIFIFRYQLLGMVFRLDFCVFFNHDIWSSAWMVGDPND